MCGILFLDLAGVPSVHPDPTGDAEVARIAAAHGGAVAHRGPESSAHLLVGGRHLLAFHRLAIVSTEGGASSSGMQPFRSGRAAMICNGEIYNHADVASWLLPAEERASLRSDVDVVLRSLLSDAFDEGEAENIRLVDDEGAACSAVAELDGDFAFVCADGERVVAGRDPLGVRPMFYGMSLGGDVGDVGRPVIGFASEAKALVGIPGVAEVRVFPPGHVFLGNTGNASGRFVPYFHALPAPFPPPEHEEGAPATMLRLLTAAVEKRVRHSDRPVALLCSGGIDSAAVASIVAKMARDGEGSQSARHPEASRGIRVFTMRYKSGQSDDAFYASLLCKHLGFDHEIVEFGPEDLDDATVREVVRACETCDPNTVRAAIPMFLLARHIATATDVKVILSGEGADELLGGYGYFRLAPDAEAASDECARLLRNLHMFDLLRADRCFAAHGLEVRVPFLDVALVRWAAGRLVSSTGAPALPRREPVIPQEPGTITYEDLLPRSGPFAAAACDRALKRKGPPPPEKQLLRDAVAGFEELGRFRILERPKEKFSDGTGFSYVPDLLRRLATDWADGGDDGTLGGRLAAESAAYKAMFADAFGGHGGPGRGEWVIARTMPDFVIESAKDAAASPSLCMGPQ